MDHKTTSNENLAEALKLLEDAAVQKKDELKEMLTGKCTNLLNVLAENHESKGGRSLSDIKNQALDAVLCAKVASLEKARDVVDGVDRTVHQNPWPYLAGTAAFGLLFGYVLGRNRK